MNVLVVGASGATGQLLVEQLLQRGCQVKVLVRASSRLPDSIRNSENVTIVRSSISDLADSEIAQLINGCDAVASCLGHNMTFKGIYGAPRRLVTDVTRRLCDALKERASNAPAKFVLMNTTGNSNRDLSEEISFAQRCVISLLRLLLPPHVDNEQAADFLRTEIGQENPKIEWVAVRPDGLVNESEVSEYEIHASPTRSAIFDAGKVSRINVGAFMAALITEEDLWMKWQGQMPVIYSKEHE